MSWVSLLPLALLIAGGCNQTDSRSTAPHVAGTETAVTTAAVAPGAAPAHGVESGAKEAMKGRVAEVLEVTSYTYLRLATATGDVWAAVPKTSVAVGADVTLLNPMRMADFESKTLKRKFDVIYFGDGIETAGGGAPTAATGATSPPHPAPATVEITDVKVEKAAGPDARTIAEIYAQKAALKDQSVTVRGKVVKFTAGILGRNWVHLRDGTGTADGKDNDLTVTTQGTTAAGDVVIAKGVVHLEKNFGAGYSYPVILEDASLTK